MTTYDWPKGSKAFMPRAARWRQIPNSRNTTSAMSGYTQTGSVPGTRWGLALDMPAHSYDERRQVGAFLSRLDCSKHRVNMFDPVFPLPQGVIQPGGVSVYSAAAQFAESLVLAGCAGRNLVVNGSFEARGGDQRPYGFYGYNNAIISISFVAAAGRIGGLAFALRANATSNATFGLVANFTEVGISGGVLPAGWQPGRSYVLSFYARKASGAGWSDMFLAWNTAPSVVTTLANPVLSGAWQRYAFAITWGGTVEALGRCFVSVSGTTAAGDEIHIDDLQVEEGAAATAYASPATLLAGSWLVVNGQRLQVATDAQADDTGRMPVEVRHALRAAATAGAPVTLDTPRALMMLNTSSEPPQVPYDGNGLAPPFTIDLVEAFV